MSTSSDKPGDSPTPPKSQDVSTVLLLLGIAGDTTWRMFVPVIGLTALGIWGDRSFETKPWLTIVGLAIGTGLAALLVRQQLKKDPTK
jgi:Putative F0F1-ATPase subunit Ca2+/Mg2+ transporter